VTSQFNSRRPDNHASDVNNTEEATCSYKRLSRDHP
jgi:hypothetical protein